MLYRCSSASIPSHTGRGGIELLRTGQMIPGGSCNCHLEGHELWKQLRRRRWSLQFEAWEHAFPQIRISRGLALEVGLSPLWPIVDSCAH
jgi:hypothetical protein